MKKKKIITTIFSLISCCATGQTDSLQYSLKISGYIEPYFAYDFGNPSNHQRPGFIYSFNRHNEVNLNLGFVKAAYQTDKVRSNLALMSGTYTNANLAAEPGVLKNIFEANAGVKISRSKNVWLDAGIFSSHIGFESAVGKDCWNVTRSILADNSPYYESGAKLSYTSNNEHWFLSGLILNGWQSIQRVNGNNTPAFGHQISYKPNSKFSINSSSFIGSDTPDSVGQMRYFHNLYSQWQLHKKLGIITGFDIGAQQKSKGSNDYNIWYAPVLIVKVSAAKNISIAGRAEYYRDAHNVIINTATLNGFQTFGYSLNLDYSISDNAMWRIEARAFSSKDEIFMLDNKPSRNNYFVTTSLAISF